MSSVPEPQQFQPGRSSLPFAPWMLALLTVLIAGTAAYLITNHWLHILDALPYLGVVLMMGMYLFMHGGYGGHGGHGNASRGPGGDGAGHVH